jgi:hypothetical protein
LAGTPVPSGFVGMNANGWLFQNGSGLAVADQFYAMAQRGVQSLRMAFNWAEAQPYSSWSQVPADQTSNYVDVGGIPTNWAPTDELVNLAALYGLRLLPVVMYAPHWDAVRNPHGILAPARAQPYADFLTALIERYGPHGSYWVSGAPRLPIRQWQIWNEPDVYFYWPQTNLHTYLTLLSAAHAAIAKADPGAQTVLAALANNSWGYLAQIYKVRGARSLFDVVAINPFTSTPQNVIRILQLARKAMNAAGDRRKPMIVSETGWPSARGQPGTHWDWDTNEAGQARNLSALLPLLAANRSALRLRGFYYYTWVSDPTLGNDWNYAGLLELKHGQPVAKPALAAFTRAAAALEGH